MSEKKRSVTLLFFDANLLMVGVNSNASKIWRNPVRLIPYSLVLDANFDPRSAKTIRRCVRGVHTNSQFGFQCLDLSDVVLYVPQFAASA